MSGVTGAAVPGTCPSRDEGVEDLHGALRHELVLRGGPSRRRHAAGLRPYAVTLQESVPVLRPRALRTRWSDAADASPAASVSNPQTIFRGSASHSQSGRRRQTPAA